MAPSKTPAFAVCGGVSVETVVTGVGRRRSSGKTTRKNAVAGLADSLYADLLWDCGGANVENSPAPVGTASSMQALPNEDFSDVFGGPPKFASISSQLSFRSGVTKVSDACFNGLFLIESSASTLTGFDMTGQSPLRNVQTRFEHPPPTSSPTKSVKVRSTTEADFSSRICYSDSDNNYSHQHNGDFAITGKEFSTVLPGATSSVRTATTLVSQREASRCNVPEDTKPSSISKSARKDFIGMKEKIEDLVLKVRGTEEEGKLANVHETTASVIKGSQDRKQKWGQYAHNKSRRLNHNFKIRMDNSEELWLSIHDVQCATEPSKFPPPSRSPPELKLDNADVSKNLDEAASSINERHNSAGPALPKQSIFESGSLSSSSTQELNTKATYGGSRVIEDAVEITEAKIKTVLEARERAKLMVDSKLKEKRRAQQLKERSARERQPGGKGDFKGHIEKGDKENSRVCCSKRDMNKVEAEQNRRRDIARRCIGKVTRELHNQSASSVLERLADFRLSHNFEEPVEIGIEGHTEKFDVNRSTVHIEPASRVGIFWLETSGGYQKQSSCVNRSEKIVKETINVPREQQQDPLSRSSFSVEQKEFDDFSSLDEFDSLSSTRDESFSTGFQEIPGETLERRMARWDRYYRTAARMAKALEEKKQRDLECQKEQAERHRAAEMLDEEIKGWASGKEGNLEALLCSLHLVLWPECGWKVVSPADILTAAAVKKVYRRATVCVHPDKVQQRGATVAQKYIAEKVFDLLREASAIYK
ncbi:hypothetical protein L7F22_037031 [Adiantum nelumboides]|nr:hypothetical protein [Adiantum nelumboides]